MASRVAQIEMHFPREQPKRVGWGGWRENAGRPRRLRRRQVPHRRRPVLDGKRFPVHVSVRLVDGLPRLRNFDLCKVLKRAFIRGCLRDRFRICQFSVLGNHIHLICEAADANALACGIQGWKVRVARGLNNRWGRSGTVFDGRYHEEILTSPTQVRNAVCYVMQNALRHGERLPRWAGGIDPFSSAWYFDGWRDDGWRTGLPPPVADPEAPGDPVAAARTWLLRVGWRLRGLVGIGELPAAGRRAGRGSASTT
jgi:REP element-mobilizing transposase RayT